MNIRNSNTEDLAFDLEEIGVSTPVKNIRTTVEKNKGQSRTDKAILPPDVSKALGFQAEGGYQFSYAASRHEAAWLLDSLSDFYDQKWFDDILRAIKGGKEASVYLCRTSTNQPGHMLAAKVYRPRRFRNLKKDHLYREGRSQLDGNGKIVLDDRALHAMQQRTRFGKELLHTSWLGHEFKTMQILFEAGVDIPKPLVSGSNAILMGYVGDEEMAAPALNEIHLTPTEARPLYQRTLHNIELMLMHNRVHADLSAYNILYWDGEITLIDFPQAIHPDENTNAFRIFSRDVTRVSEYFAAQGVKSDPAALSRKMWQSKGRPLNPPLDPAYLDPEKEEDRRVWKKQ